MSGAPISPAIQQKLMEAEFLVQHGGITVMFSGMPNHTPVKDLQATIKFLQGMEADCLAFEERETAFAIPHVELDGLPGGEA